MVPAYEIAFHAAMAAILWHATERRALRRQRLKLYFIAYAAFRFGVEFIRVEPRVAWGLTGYQFGAAALAAVMALLWWMDERVKARLSGGGPA